MRRFLPLAALTLAATLSGCGGGYFFTHVVEPLDVNLDNTPVFQAKGGSGNTKRVRYYVDIEWDSNGIGDIVRRAGLDEVHYADLETLSIAGIWQQRFVNVYGK